MIAEDYVSFETAKLLKEKGFPQEYDNYHALVYNEEDYEDEYEVQRFVLETKLVKAGTLSSYPVGVPDPKCYCCTLQMAMKWLRKEYKIHIQIWILEEKGYWFNIEKILNAQYKHKSLYSTGLEDIYFESHEQACEEAIKYCLEHLI